MSSSDDPFDKKLRKHFQDVFDDFDVQPSASLKERIWQQLAKPVVDRQYGQLLVGLLLLIGTGFVYQQYDSKLRSYQAKISQARIDSPFEPIVPDLQVTARETHSTHGSQRFTEISNSPGKTNTLSPKRKNTNSLQSISQPVDQLVSVRSVKQNWLSSNSPQIERNEIPNRHPVGPRTRQLAAKIPDTFYSQTDQPNHTETPELHLSTPTVQPKAIDEVAASTSVSWQLLESLPIHMVGKLSAQINRNVDVHAPAESGEQPIKQKVPVRWLISVTPLSTYQLMTVVDKPNTYVQRVDVPAAFSGPTWGYQFRAGIEWRHYDIELSFGQVRRWAYYDLATNTFQVQPTGANKYDVIRLEQPVSENVSLSMLGASLTKQYKLGGIQSRYFARLGGAISYVPDTRQSMLWAKATVGAALPLLKAYQLQVGPTIEYGFSRVWSTERQLIIRPYLVGASITLRPNKP